MGDRVNRPLWGVEGRGLLRLFSVIGGVLVGLVIVCYRNWPGADRLSPDALKIWRISSGQRPGFTDRSFTPVATIYRSTGLGDAPLVAGMIGFLLAVAVIAYVVFRVGAAKFTLVTGIYVFGALVLSAWYLGQYSKDVFVLPIVALLVVNRRLWWDVVVVAAMLAYMYVFRDYWALIAVAYVGYRVVTWVQARVRYLIIGGATVTALIGLAIYFVQERPPAYYRTKAVDYYEPTTALVSLDVLPEPYNGLLDVISNYFLLYLPAQLPVAASLIFVAVTAVLGFLRIYPLYVARSANRWPSRSTRDGVVVRRALSLLSAFIIVQAIFEPDYGSVLRHLAPLLGVGIALTLSARNGERRRGTATPWSWTGGARTPEKPALRRRTI